MVLWNTAQIINKIRNITGTPSTNQLTDAQVLDYVNTYYTFTMPFELKEQINLQPLNFSALPNIDTYSFPGAFLTDQPMAYADGFPLIFYQDRDIFFQDWPQQYAQDSVSTGNGVLTNFTGTTQAYPIIQGTFLFTDGSQVLTDYGTQVITEEIDLGDGGAAYSGILDFFPIDPGSLSITDDLEVFGDNGAGVLTGSLGGTGTINYTTGAWAATFNSVVAVGDEITGTYRLPASSGVLTGDGTGTINYTTGAFDVTFNTAPASTDTIYDKYQAYQPARPQGVLFYNNIFTFRPIPDQGYAITMQGYVNQIQLTGDASTPLSTEWGQLIAYGASLDIFADRGDLVAYNNTYPIFKRYENVALGRTVQQYDSSQAVPRF